MRPVIAAPAPTAALPPPWTRPDAVPVAVDDAALAATLAHGRPAGDTTLLAVDGLRIPMISTGAGAPVLCVHGLGHDAWDWTPLFVRCSNIARLHALDLPGFGFADKRRAGGAFDLALLTDAVIAAARACDAPPVVVASSLGGHVALLAALRAPTAFRSLLLSAPGGLVEVPAAMQAVLRAYYAVDAIVGRSDAEIVANSRRIFARPGSAPDDALAARKLAVHRSLRARDFAQPFSDVVDDVFHHVVLERLGALRVPTVICSGARDVVVPPDACAAAARRLACRFVSFPDTGHCPHLEVPDAFADLVRTTLDAAAPA